MEAILMTGLRISCTPGKYVRIGRKERIVPQESQTEYKLQFGSKQTDCTVRNDNAFEMTLTLPQTTANLGQSNGDLRAHFLRGLQPYRTHLLRILVLCRADTISIQLNGMTNLDP
jgi:hypothetical protein